MAERVTRVVVEAAIKALAQQRVTRVVVEVAVGASSAARVTRVVAEAAVAAPPLYEDPPYGVIVGG